MCNEEAPLVRREGRTDLGFGIRAGESIGRLRRRNLLEIELGVITGYNMLQWVKVLFQNRRFGTFPGPVTVTFLIGN
jgi:hypothetical protein